MNIVFRVDASSEIGTGHVIRCLTLANKLRADGKQCTFICRNHKGNLIEQIRKQAFEVFVLPQKQECNVIGYLQHAPWLGCEQATDAAESRLILQELHPDWLVVDHYGIDVEWEELLRDTYKSLLVIDDLADRKHCCDVLVDQNLICNEEKKYSTLVPSSCNQLLGPTYAILRDEFKHHRLADKQIVGVTSIFAFFGGVDEYNLTTTFIQALDSEYLRNVSVDVVIGTNNTHVKSINTNAGEHKNVTLHSNVQNMAEIMSQSDIAIGACGSSTWERMCLGLPSMVVIAGENESHIANELASLGLIELLGTVSEISSSSLTCRIMKFSRDIDKLRQQQNSIFQTVNGHGTERLAEQMQ